MTALVLHHEPSKNWPRGSMTPTWRCGHIWWRGKSAKGPARNTSRQFSRKDVPTEPTFLILGLCLDSKNVDYLKDLCRSLRLPVSGRKAEIVSRIVNHYRTEAAR